MLPRQQHSPAKGAVLVTMVILKAFRYRLYPNQAQQGALAIQFGHTRFVYNWGLTIRHAHYREHGKGLYYHDTALELAKLKRDPKHEWLREADSQALQQKLRDLDRAYVNFFEGRARYPSLKKKHANQSIRYPQRFKLSGKRVYLPKVG